MGTERQRLSWPAPSVEALREKYQSELRHKRFFLPGSFRVGERELLVLVLVHPNGADSYELQAEAVYHKPDEPGAGVGLALLSADAATMTALERFVRTEADVAQTEAAPAATGPGQDSRDNKNLYQRVRGLSVRERENMARMGALHERVALERVWGGGVWDLLLQNRQLTPAEVAQIGRNPSLGSTQVAAIVNNAGWLGKPEVQQALLQNPRVTGPLLDRVLRAVPKPELGRLAQQPNARQAVRAAAKKLQTG